MDFFFFFFLLITLNCTSLHWCAYFYGSCALWLQKRLKVSVGYYLRGGVSISGLSLAAHRWLPGGIVPPFLCWGCFHSQEKKGNETLEGGERSVSVGSSLDVGGTAGRLWESCVWQGMVGMERWACPWRGRWGPAQVPTMPPLQAEMVLCRQCGVLTVFR